MAGRLSDGGQAGFFWREHELRGVFLGTWSADARVNVGRSSARAVRELVPFPLIFLDLEGMFGLLCFVAIFCRQL